ncbi:MAG: glutathione S-transferase [Rhodobacteraceae bacterium]|nr:glutathione S-transferase [Paracoccaceae bacterium]
MTYELFIGDRSFSSWSLRGWLMFANFDIPVKTHMLGLYSGTLAKELAPLAPARLVPVMRTADGVIIGDTMAIAETLAEAHPVAGHWPAATDARALARWLCAEMHSGFEALRADCPMTLRVCLKGYQPSDPVRKDLARLETLWAHAQDRFGADGPWLFGKYSLADAFYAPAAMRIAAYGLPVSDRTRAYVDCHLADKATRRWRAMGQTVSYTPEPYSFDLEHVAWPGPTPLEATITDGPSVNTACPYSDLPVTHFAAIGGNTYGFCNAFCRDKTIADPAAWPKFMDIYLS